jgi:DNA-3-methyladenine glycosylase I
MKELNRCAWAKSDLMVRYHDQEWGVPIHDDAMLFEFLCLEGAQAGLSWETILKKRENYREVFDGFLPTSSPNTARKRSRRFWPIRELCATA